MTVWQQSAMFKHPAIKRKRQKPRATETSVFSSNVSFLSYLSRILMIDADTLQVPFVQSVHTLVYFNLVVPSQPVQLRHVRQLAQRAVRLRRIPEQLALETDFSHYLLCHLSY